VKRTLYQEETRATLGRRRENKEPGEGLPGKDMEGAGTTGVMGSKNGR
jgi:hypothetical protein